MNTANTSEAQARVVIDERLREQGWSPADYNSVQMEFPLPDGSFSDYMLKDRNGRPIAALEAKKSSKSAAEGQVQGKHYAEQAGVPFAFMSNGEEIRFWDIEYQAHPRPVASFFTQEDIERRIASRQFRKELDDVEIDKRIVERDYQHECINTLCEKITQGKRKLLVEMATGSGKTRMAAALIKRMFEAQQISRVLFVVDRITLAKQAEDAFTEHLSDLSCYILKQNNYKTERQITIATLQTIISSYDALSAGYFDLIIIDECHRSIYGEYRRTLEYFDGIKIGLTATPCVASEETLAKLDKDDSAFVRDTLRFFEVDEPTYRYHIKEAIADGWLVPYFIYRAKTFSIINEEGFEVERTDIDWDALPQDERDELEKLFGDDDTIIIEPSALERRFTIPQRNKEIVRDFRKAIDGGVKDKAPNVPQPRLGKTIVFAVTKRHAETLARLFDDEFAHQKPNAQTRFADYVVSDMTFMGDNDASTLIKQFKDEEYPKILVSVGMLDTGFDAPAVENLVMARYTHSSILYQQMRGRGSRLAGWMGKQCFWMFDYVGVTEGDDEVGGEGGFVTIKPPKPPGKPRKLLTVDVDDWIEPGSRMVFELDDDGNIVRPAEVVAKAEERGTRFSGWFNGWLTENDDASYEKTKWLKMIGAQIKANAETDEAFEMRDFVRAPFNSIGGIRKANELFGDTPQLEQLVVDINTAVYEERQSH